MAYSLVGEAAHEWIGIAMLALFILIGLSQFTRNYTQTTKRGLLTTNKG